MTRDGVVEVGPMDFFAGFGNEALVAICALMMVGKALETTGALQPLANVVGRAWSSRPVLALLTTLVAGAILSAFMNNTPIVVLLMPIIVGASLALKVSGIGCHDAHGARDDHRRHVDDYRYVDQPARRWHFPRHGHARVQPV